MSRGVWIILLGCLLQQAPACARDAVAQGRFARAPCPKSILPGEGVVCGVLTVPENRHRAHSRTIRLPVVVFHSRADTPAPDPVVFLPGGPGGSALVHPLPARDNPFLAERDYVLLEPRGARLAQPALECPRINALLGIVAAGHLSGEAGQAALARAAAACRAALVAKGVDLDGYTSAETAQDLEDLRKALGYARWNLFGHSYGTRLALTVLRDHPQGVRSVILDSVLPPEVGFDEHASANLRRALDAVFDGCAVDPACARAHPQPAAEFARLVAQADRSPLPLPSVRGSDGRAVTVRGAQVVAALYEALHDPAAIGHIPAVIGDSLAGRTAALARLVAAGQGASSFAWGLRLSVWCGEEMPFEDRVRVEAQLAPAWGLGGVDERTASPGTCRAWGVAPAAARENAPVTSDVPVLALAGEFDPDTPPAWARQLVANMPHARVVVFPGQSHGAGFNRCGAALETAFLHDPGGPLPLDCVLTMRGADFGASGRP
ncbi:alpha/beta fold hydrolase [Fulvimonas yonginensis]|uniref:Alpha/beta fold hydrolase n=1 Tax=Fulvimonas yonginensis TaxID=1495200 RepID=A0ABU8JCX6_9GAMM